MENNVSMEMSEPKKTTQRERFEGFALSHVLISVIGFGIGLPVGLGLANLSEFEWFIAVAIAGDAVLLLVYAFAGAWMARKKQWSFPQRFREGVRAFLAPALIAWGWAALVIFSVFAAVWPLLMVEFFGSMVFAFPSFLMVYLALVLNWLVSEVDFCLWAVLAGGIPPLLFFLGSLLGSRRNMAKTDENESADVKEHDVDV